MSRDIFSRWQSHYTSLIIGKHSSHELQDLFNNIQITGLRFMVLFKIKTTGKKKVEIARELRDKEKEIMGMFSQDNSLNKMKKYFKKS